MNYRSFFLLALFALFLGCQKDSLRSDLIQPEESISQQSAFLSPLKGYQVDPGLMKGNPHLNGNPVTKTIKLSSSGVIEFIPASSDCGGYLKVLIQGSGNASHLGKFRIELSYCSDGVMPIGPILGSQTAANGDQLFTQMVGAGKSALGDYQDYIYYGGTGRFEKASGSIRLYGIVDYQNQVWNNHGVGSITY